MLAKGGVDTNANNAKPHINTNADANTNHDSDGNPTIYTRAHTLNA